MKRLLFTLGLCAAVVATAPAAKAEQFVTVLTGGTSGV